MGAFEKTGMSSFDFRKILRLSARSLSSQFRTIVVGGGHAGTEAAHIASQTSPTLLLTPSPTNNLGEMSCNPSMGGIGKGTLIREIDALGGLMAKACDEAGIHFRILNRRMGAAVHGPRAQMDRLLYKQAIQEKLKNADNLTIRAGRVVDLLVDWSCSRIKGVKLDSGEEIESDSVVITTGTFLRGEIHIGLESFPAGRVGEDASHGLSETLSKAGFKLGRMRTGKEIFS